MDWKESGEVDEIEKMFANVVVKLVLVRESCFSEPFPVLVATVVLGWISVLKYFGAKASDQVLVQVLCVAHSKKVSLLEVDRAPYVSV